MIVADLCEEANRDWPLVSRTLARLAGIYERHGPPRDMKLLFRHDKKATRQTVERILSWDFDRMILSHGRLVETGAHDVLVIEGDAGQVLIPFVRQIVTSVDLTAGRLIAEWQADY